MRTSTIEAEVPTAESVHVTEDTLSVDLSDGRTITVPLVWFPRLAHGTTKERKNSHPIGTGYGIHSEDLDGGHKRREPFAGAAVGGSVSRPSKSGCHRDGLAKHGTPADAARRATERLLKPKRGRTNGRRGPREGSSDHEGRWASKKDKPTSH